MCNTNKCNNNNTMNNKICVIQMNVIRIIIQWIIQKN